MTADLVPAAEPNPDARLAELTAQWLKSRRSEFTRRAYYLDIQSWLVGWCQRVGLHPLAARKGDIMEWLAWLATPDPSVGRDKPESGATRSRRLGAVSGWYEWLIDHDMLGRNPARLRDTERPVIASRSAPALSTEQAERLLGAADADTPRAAAIVYLMTYCGVRVGELLAADVGDIGMTDGEMVLHVRGKGGKPRTVRLNPSVLDRINRYLAARPDRTDLPVTAAEAGAGTDRPLFATYRGKRIDPKGIRRLLQRLAREAGLPEQVADKMTPHTTRATYATRAIAAGLDLRAVQATMGHANPSTTMVYDRSDLTPDRDPAIRLLGIIRPPQRTEETN